MLIQGGGAIGPQDQHRFIAEAQGNSLALLELPVALRYARSERRHLADVLPLTARLQALFDPGLPGFPRRPSH
jgi:hypothetical protein